MKDLIIRAEQFAQERHYGQFRKGAAKEPYIIHLKEVSSLVKKYGGSDEVIAAAWLHDTIEDCPPTNPQELERNFGRKVAGIVSELTDDKSLSKKERKLLQLENARYKSQEAALVKLADKTSNVGALANSPPLGWPLGWRLDYINWAKEVVFNLCKLPRDGLEFFKRRCDQAELQAFIDLGTERMAQNAAMRILERKSLRSGASRQQTDKLLINLMNGTLNNYNDI